MDKKLLFQFQSVLLFSNSVYSMTKYLCDWSIIILVFQDKCQVLYIHNLPISVTQAVLRKRFKAFGEPEDCRVLVKKE